MAETIVDLVRRDERLQTVLKELLKREYLLPGIFHPEAYLIHQEPLEEKWHNRPTDKSIEVFDVIAIGVAIYNQMFGEATANHLAGEDPSCNPETSDWCEEWEEYVYEQFADNWDVAEDEKDVIDVASKLGQYLEFMNRKSQNF